MLHHRRKISPLGRVACAAALLLMLPACDDDAGTSPPDGALKADAGAVDGGGDGAGKTDTRPRTDGGRTSDARPAKERIEIPGLSAPVTAYLDASGILHLSCQTDDDCFAAEGYMHARHRFFQMDLRRRLARGTLSEVVGALGLPFDIARRRRYATRDGKPLAQIMFDKADAATRSGIRAYTRGVNAWIADLRKKQHGAKTAKERSFALINKSVLTDWTVLDTVSSVFLLIDQLTNGCPGDARFAEAVNLMGPDRAQDIAGPRPPSPSTVIPRSGPRPAQSRLKLRADHLALIKAAKPLLDFYLGRTKKIALDLGGEGGASNNWVVGPKLAGAGRTLLANDPHLGLSNPSIWYLIHMDARTAGKGRLHIAGASFAGLPGIVLGQNEDIAWGATNTMADFCDLYVETLSADGKGVMFKGKKVAFIERKETFKVSGGKPVTRTFYYVPHHGPVVAGPDTKKTGKALTLRWTLADADTDLKFLMALWTSRSVQEAKAALKNVTTIGQNWVVIDRKGNFGWFPYNRWRERPFAKDYPSRLPLPGTGEAEWGAPIPYDKLPQLMNPAQGFIATANNDYTGAMLDGNPIPDGKGVYQWDVADGYRHERIVQRLREKRIHDMRSMQSIQADTRSLIGERTVPAILAAAGAARALTAGAKQVRDALKAWKFTCPSGMDGIDPATAKPAASAAVRTEAIGCAAFHVTFSRLRKRVFDDETKAARLPGGARTSALVFALTEKDPFGGRDYWDDVSTRGVKETRADMVAAALDDAAKELVKKLGASPGGWLWGKLHAFRLRADLFSSFGLTTYDSPERINDGGTSTVDVAHPGGNGKLGWGQTAGASMRFVCEATAAKPVSCTIELPGGQVHHRDDPFYLSLFPDWLRNRPRPIPFSISAVKASARRTITFVKE